MTGGLRAVQTQKNFAGFPMVLQGVGATSGHENGLDMTAAADCVGQGRGRADQVGLSSGLEDRNVGQAVPDVVELRVAKDSTNRFHLAVAFCVMAAVTRNDAIEHPEVGGDRVGYAAVRRGGEKDPSTRGALAFYEFDHVTPIG